MTLQKDLKKQQQNPEIFVSQRANKHFVLFWLYEDIVLFSFCAEDEERVRRLREEEEREEREWEERRRQKEQERVKREEEAREREHRMLMALQSHQVRNIETRCKEHVYIDL